MPIVDTSASATKKIVISNILGSLFTTAGDIFQATSAGLAARLGIGTARQYLRVNSGATALEWGSGITILAEQSTGSGSNWDFTIPSGAKRVTLMLKGFSTNGTNVPLIQLGDAGGIENSGYLGIGSGIGAGIGTGNWTSGFGLRDTWSSAYVVHGSYVLNLEDASDFTWTCNGGIGNSDSAVGGLTFGSKSLSQELTTVRLVTADAGDAGVASASYEF